MEHTECTHCGARLSPLDEKCKYCGSVTAAFVARQRQEEQREHARVAAEAARALQARSTVEAEVAAAASKALVISIVGSTFCIIPMLPVVGLVYGLRARSLAQAHGLAVPGGAIAAIWVSVVSLAGTLIFGFFTLVAALVAR